MWPFLIVVVTLVFLGFLVWLFRDRIESVKFLGGNELKLSRKAEIDLAVNGSMLVGGGEVFEALKAKYEIESQSQIIRPVGIDATSEVGPPTVSATAADDVSLTDEVSAVIARDERSVEDARRAQLELVINSAAEWGWTMSKMGRFKNFPHPVVEWDADGQPKIIYGTTDPAVISDAEARAAASSVVSAVLTASGTVTEHGEEGQDDT